MNNINSLKENTIDVNKILFPLIFLPCVLIPKILDNDIWFLLNSGRYVMNFGIPYIEPFTIHSNMKFVMQQWLSSVIFWLVYSNFGDAGIYFIMYITFIVMVYFMYKIAYLISKGNFLITYAITLFFSIIFSLIIKSRPIIFTILLVLMELYALEKYIDTKDKRYLFVLPFLSLLSINMHAAMWPILFVILLPYMIDSLKIRTKFILFQGYYNKDLVIAIGLMILIAFINPYGVDSMTYLFRSYGYPEISNYVNEMKPPNINNAFGMFVFALFFILVMIYIKYSQGKSTVRYFLLTVGTGIMVLFSNRNIYFFIICSFFPLAYYFRDIKINSTNKIISRKYFWLKNVLISAIIILLVSNFFINDSEYEDKEFNNLKDIIAYVLETNDVSKISMYTGYRDGSYAEFMGVPSYLDPRAEVFIKNNNNKDDILKEYRELQDGELYYKIVLEKYDFTHLLVSKDDILCTYLSYDDDYIMIKSNEDYYLYKSNK